MSHCVVVPLPEGVYISVDPSPLRYTSEFNGVTCRVLLPSSSGHLGPLKPPHNWHPWDPRSHIDWPDANWGYVNSISPMGVTIRAVGLHLTKVISTGEELIRFDEAVAQWKHLLKDWLGVLAEGSTDFVAHAKGETIWDTPEYNEELMRACYYAGDIYEPEHLTCWEWEHALGHAVKGDRPPIARVLLAEAQRAAAIGNWRVAIIDAATAAEIALTTGLTAKLTADASPDVVKALIDRTRMLGPRVSLAKDLGMTLPLDIHTDLLTPRNALVHRGAETTGPQAWSAIAVARILIDEYEPIPAHCQEPEANWEPIDCE